MAQASSYTKLTELTAEQQAKFKETATVLAQGKTATDGATTDINIPFSEFSGGGGGGSSSPYARDTAEFGEVYQAPAINPEYTFNYQAVTVANNTYTIANGFKPYIKYQDSEGTINEIIATDAMAIHISGDFPMAVVCIKDRPEMIENLPAGSELIDSRYVLRAIRVFNGDNELKRVYPVTIDNDTENQPQVSYSLKNFAHAERIEIHILGDTYTIYSDIGEASGLSA